MFYGLKDLEEKNDMWKRTREMKTESFIWRFHAIHYRAGVSERPFKNAKRNRLWFLLECC